MIVKLATSGADLVGIYPLITEYVHRLHPDRPGIAAELLFNEMLHNVSDCSHVVLYAVDGPQEDVIGFAFARDIDNYGERVIFVTAIHAIVAGGGRKLFGELCTWGKGRGCRRLAGLVDWKRWPGHAAIWGCEPTKVWIERTL